MDLFSAHAFQGRKALVTGAGGGVGRAVCDALLRAGAEVIAADVESSTGIAGTTYVRADITELDTINSLAGLVERAGGLDILVNTAGIIAKAPFGHTDWDIWEKVYDVNCRATMRLCEALLPHLRASEAGRIVTIASMTASNALPTYAPYSSAKAAVLNASRVLAAELADTGITVNTISPGWIDTPMTVGLYRKMESLHGLEAGSGRRYVERLIPQGRLVTPEEVAAAVLFFASGPGGAMTGVDLPMDGGLTTMFTPGVHQARIGMG